MNFIKNNIKPFLITSTLFGVGGYSYLYYTAYTNRKELQIKKDNEVEFKDNTRPQNQYFGLSYGFRADQIVLDRLDSGDFIFMKFDCLECITEKDILKCYYSQLMKPYPHYDSFGIVFRDNRNVYVLYNRFGDIVIEDYAEFLQNPFWSEITVRKIVTTLEVHKNIKSLFYDENYKKQFENASFITRILQQTGLVDQQFMDKLDQVYIEDLDVDEFGFFKKGVTLGPKINVRTKRNRDLDAK